MDQQLSEGRRLQVLVFSFYCRPAEYSNQHNLNLNLSRNPRADSVLLGDAGGKCSGEASCVFCSLTRGLRGQETSSGPEVGSILTPW